MRAEEERGAVRTATPKSILQKKCYQTPMLLSNKIDELLAGLLFCLQNPHLTISEKATVLNCIDGLIRLKIDCGLVRKQHYGS
jgi:hypothetical protein